MRAAVLADVVHINPRSDAVAADTPISFVGMAELDDVTAVARPRTTRPFSDVAKGYTIFRDGDILAAKITPCWENGKVGQAHLDEPIGVGSTEFHVLRPGPKVHDRYLLHFLRQSSVRDTGEIRMTGSGGQRRVPTRFLETLTIPLPSLEEQWRIAAILDKADALRGKRRQVLAHLDDLTQAIFHDMFGDPISNRRGLPRQSIGDLADVVTGNSPSRSDVDNFGDDIEWIKSDNLGGDVASMAEERLSKQGRSKARVAPAGSILVTCIAGSPMSIGKASRVDREVAFNQQINAILPSADVDTLFLLGQLKTAPTLVREKSTGGMKGLVNKSAFKSIRVLAPPLLLQREFAARLARVSAFRVAANEAVARDEQLFASLQSRAFRGEL